jgi:hypothetical protein
MNMEQGKFAYRKNLEAARKALLDRTGTKYQAPDAKEQLQGQQQGLMRPRSRPPVDESGSLADGLGLALMENMQARKEEQSEEGLKSSLRPQEPSRSDSNIMDRNSSLGSFAAKLKQSESSGRDDVQITIDDGRTMTGGYQFGDDRLTDYKEANKTKFSTEEFRKDTSLQNKVFKWHINDIDKAIAKLPGSSKMSTDGLRAVAHLGGKSGMKKYVTTGGKYNPADKFGTRLSDYYNKFK